MGFCFGFWVESCVSQRSWRVKLPPMLARALGTSTQKDDAKLHAARGLRHASAAQ